MAATVIEFLCVPGQTTAYLTAAGGTGTAAVSYPITQIAGYLHKITVAEALLGRWYLGVGNAAGDFGNRIIDALVDSAVTFPYFEETSLAGQPFVSGSHDLYSLATGSVVTPDSVAAAVWDALQSSHLLVGSFGAAFHVAANYINPNANQINIIRNDAYNGTANDKITWAVAKDFTSGWSGTFTCRHRETGVVLLTKAIVVTDATTLSLTLEVADTDFADLTVDAEFGPHPYDIEMLHTGGSKQTIVLGVANILKDYSL